MLWSLWRFFSQPGGLVFASFWGFLPKIGKKVTFPGPKSQKVTFWGKRGKICSEIAFDRAFLTKPLLFNVLSVFYWGFLATSERDFDKNGFYCVYSAERLKIGKKVTFMASRKLTVTGLYISILVSATPKKRQKPPKKSLFANTGWKTSKNPVQNIRVCLGIRFH